MVAFTPSLCLNSGPKLDKIIGYRQDVMFEWFGEIVSIKQSIDKKIRGINGLNSQRIRTGFIHYFPSTSENPSEH